MVRQKNSQDEHDAELFAESHSHLLRVLIITVQNTLIEECHQQTDGRIHADDIEAICSRLRSNETLTTKLNQRTVLEFLAWRQEKPSGERRGKVLNRMVASRFEELLVHQVEKETITTHIPRRACMGILDGFRKQVGEVNFDSLNEGATQLMNSLGPPSEDGSYSREHWQAFFGMAEAEAIIQKFEVCLAIAYLDYRRNKIWIIDATNTYLEGLTSRLIEPGTGRWRFREIHFVEIMKRFVDSIERTKAGASADDELVLADSSIRAFSDCVYEDLQHITEDGLDFR